MKSAPTAITLASLPSFDHTVHPERSLRDVFDLLESNERVPGVLVFERGRLVTVLSRVKLLDMMRRRFSQELFLDRPLTEILSRWEVAPTVLSSDTTASDALSVALARHEDALCEPIVCKDARGRHRLLDMHTLMAAQCRQLAIANDLLADANRASELASKAKSDFLANMSHEIRTPMTAILGYAELLLDEGIDNGQRTAAARTIRRSGEHLLNILNDILDVSKIESGRFELEHIDHDPAALVREVVDLMRPRAAEKGVRLSVEIDENVPALVHTDPTRLRQITANLIGNAIKFTHDGQVRVWVSLDTSLGLSRTQLCVGVEDTGIGISPENLETLFQPFVQGDASMSRRFGGSGLGLTISRKLARMLGGDITVTSTQGEGSRFVATVEACLDKVSGRVLSAAAPVAASTAPINARILIAEDGVDNQRLFLHHLSKAGATVEIACDGQQAIDRATAPGAFYDLILMDMQMPCVDGYQATRTLRDKGYTRPIVALTAHAMATDRDRAIAAGCDDYLTKPINRDALLEGCRKWIAKSAAGRAA